MDPPSGASAAAVAPSPLEAAARAVALLQSRLAAKVMHRPGGIEHEDIFRTEGTINSSDSNLDGMDAAIDDEELDTTVNEAAAASRRSVQAAIDAISELDDRLAQLERKEANIAVERARHRATESARMRELEVRKEQVRMARWRSGMQSNRLGGDVERGGDEQQSLVGSAAPQLTAAAGASAISGSRSIAHTAVTRSTRVSARPHASSAQKGRYIRYDDAASVSTAKPLVRRDLLAQVQPHLHPAGLPVKLVVPRPPLPSSQLNQQALHSSAAVSSTRLAATSTRNGTLADNLDIWSHCSDDDRDGDDAQQRQRTHK